MIINFLIKLILGPLLIVGALMPFIALGLSIIELLYNLFF